MQLNLALNLVLTSMLQPKAGLAENIEPPLPFQFAPEHMCTLEPAQSIQSLSHQVPTYLLQALLPPQLQSLVVSGEKYLVPTPMLSLHQVRSRRQHLGTPDPNPNPNPNPNHGRPRSQTQRAHRTTSIAAPHQNHPIPEDLGHFFFFLALSHRWACLCPDFSLPFGIILARHLDRNHPSDPTKSHARSSSLPKLHYKT